ERLVAEPRSGRAARGPGPPALAIAVPVPQIVRVVGKAIVPLRADAAQTAYGLPTGPEPVGEVILCTGQLDQVDPAHARRIQGDTEGMRARARVDHERCVGSGRGRARGR